MKRIVLFCILITLNANMIAQIDSSDITNWNIVLDENFEGSGRGWDDSFIETRQNSLNFSPVWRCHYFNGVSGVTLDKDRHQISQKEQCVFNDGSAFNDDKLRIIAKFKSSTTIPCGDYDIPVGFGNGHHYHCDTAHHWLYYYSGNIETLDKFQYGYFEIKCKVPVHYGTFPAFWLFGNGSRRYEEIDIFEYMGDLTYENYHPEFPYLYYPYVYDSGIWQGPDENNRDRYAEKIVQFSELLPDIRGWHTYGLEWLPNRVIWYFDGEPVNEYFDETHIPTGPMTLKANYSIDNWALTDSLHFYSSPDWEGQDTLVIDHIKVYSLKVDCDEDIVVTSVSQLNGINSIKRTITIGTFNNTIALPSTTSKTLRATEIIVNGEFEVPLGAKITLITHQCPTQ